MGMDVTLKETVLNGVGFLSETELMGSKTITCFNQIQGWSVDPNKNSGAPTKMTDATHKEGKDQIYFGYPFSIFKEKGYKAESLGKQAVGNIEAYKLKVTAADGTSAIYYFDTKSGLLVKSVKESENDEGEMVKVSTTYSDYKDVNGCLLPQKKNMNIGDMLEIPIQIIKYEMNIPVESSKFEYPD